MGLERQKYGSSLCRSQPITANPGLYHALFLLFVDTRYAPGRGNITATTIITCIFKKRCNKDILLLSVQTPCFEPQSFTFPHQCPGVSDDVKSRWFLITLMVLFCELKGLKCVELNFYFQQRLVRHSCFQVVSTQTPTPLKGPFPTPILAPFPRGLLLKIAKRGKGGLNFYSSITGERMRLSTCMTVQHISNT